MSRSAKTVDSFKCLSFFSRRVSLNAFLCHFVELFGQHAAVTVEQPCWRCALYKILLLFLLLINIHRMA